ncbi:MAG: hypothetical protein LAQ69_13650 [Acidobacteriia bacterium]|nr:hypothetical protein [Terriglobia bacterium]
MLISHNHYDHQALPTATNIAPAGARGDSTFIVPVRVLNCCVRKR